MTPFKLESWVRCFQLHLTQNEEGAGSFAERKEVKGQIDICSFILSFLDRGFLTPEVLKRMKRKITAVIIFPPTLFFYFSSDSVVIHKITFLYKRA